MISRTGVSGPLPAPTARMAMSRSVIMPMSRSFSPTGMEPASISSMIFATSRMLWPGVHTRTSRVIASLTRIGPSLRGLIAPGDSKQEISRRDAEGDDCRNAKTHRDRGRNDDERRLSREGLGRGDAQEQRRGDQQPAAEIRHQQPAHGPVVRKIALAHHGGASRGVLEEGKGVQIEQDLPRQRQTGPALAAQKLFDFHIR